MRSIITTVWSEQQLASFSLQNHIHLPSFCLRFHSSLLDVKTATYMQRNSDGFWLVVIKNEMKHRWHGNVTHSTNINTIIPLIFELHQAFSYQGPGSTGGRRACYFIVEDGDGDGHRPQDNKDASLVNIPRKQQNRTPCHL